MLIIPCPYCGPRAESEFAYGGEAHIARPDPSADDAAWAGRLFLKDNPKGWTRERWRHAVGCGRWFNLCRDTSTNRVGGAYEMGEAPPAFPADAGAQ